MTEDHPKGCEFVIEVSVQNDWFGKFESQQEKQYASPKLTLVTHN